MSLSTEKKENNHSASSIVDELTNNGFAIVTGLFERSIQQSLLQEIEPHFNHAGRNAFEGYSTQRIYSLVTKTSLAHPFYENPTLLEVIKHFLGETPLLSRSQAIQICPGETQQKSHRDDFFYPVDRPRPTFGVSIMVAMDDFTSENGATLVVPGSHKWTDKHPNPSQFIPVIMPSGSALIMLAELWHCAGANISLNKRRGLYANFCAPWLRTLDNHLLSLSTPVFDEASETLLSLLGVGIHEHDGIFFGVVDGVHPRKKMHVLNSKKHTSINSTRGGKQCPD